MHEDADDGITTQAPQPCAQAIDAALEAFLKGGGTHVHDVQVGAWGVRLPAALFPPGHAHLLGCTPNNYVECKFKKRVNHAAGCITFILKKRFRFTTVGDVNLGGIMCLERAQSLLPLLYRVLLPDAAVRPFLFCKINGAMYTLREAYVGGVSNMWAPPRQLDAGIYLATVLFNDLVHRTRKLHVFSVRDTLQVVADIGDGKGMYDACADPTTVHEYAVFYRRWRMQSIRRITDALEAVGTDAADAERVRLVADFARELKERQTA